HLAAAATPGQARAEHLAAFIPGHEHGLVRLGHGEGLAIHLGLLDLKIVRETLGDLVVAVDHPDALELAGLAPLERAGSAHQALEDLREVARMQDDQAHAFPDALGDTLDHGVGNLTMRLVTPPEQD